LLANAFGSTFAVFTNAQGQAKKQQKSYQANAQRQKNEWKTNDKKSTNR
jgi:hypothetical protein